MGTKTPREQNQSVEESNQDLLPTEEAPELLTQDTIDPLEQMFNAKYNLTLSELSDPVKNIISRLDKYVESMGASVSIMSVEEGSEKQIQLLNTLIRACSLKGEDGIYGIDVVLYYINKYRLTVFSDRMVYRYVTTIKRPPSTTETFTRLLEILIKLAPPATRAAIANSQNMRKAVAIIDPDYKTVAFTLVNYLSQYTS